MRSVVLCGKGRLAKQCLAWFQQRRDWGHWVVTDVVNSADSSELHPDAWDHHKAVGGADLLLSVQYDRIFRQSDLVKFKRCLNIHYSPLPRYRGMRPVNWALKNGERVHGVTIHEIDEGIDTGPIVAQTTFSINPWVDEVDDVYRRCEFEGMELFCTVMRWWPDLPSIPQDHTQALTYTRKDLWKLRDRLHPWRDHVLPQ